MPFSCPHVTPITAREAVLTNCPCVLGSVTCPCSQLPCKLCLSKVKDAGFSNLVRNKGPPSPLDCESSEDHLSAQMHASNRPQAQSQPNSLNEITARDAPVLLSDEGTEQAPNSSAEKKISLPFNLQVDQISDLVQNI